ncbi:MAG: PEP-CTERM sorting domain-containing protein [Burkholderiales bacterium]|nr:PEP-CTERM sorting domain-containing protein [Burkholderiales bacterium]MBH2016128.1 PEP-CTERM sorting domain-containing protein [Burkholderiales bacterium]
MTYLKHLAVMAVALAASAASAANLPVASYSDSVLMDTSVLSAKNLTLQKVGNATWNATTGVLTDPVASVDLASALVIQFDASSGFALYTPGLFGPSKVATLQNFSYNVNTGTLHGDLYTPLGNLLDSDLLTASVKTGGLSGNLINVSASNFSLAAEMVTALGSNAANFQFVADAVKQVNISVTLAAAPVPEPTTYALMGLGLVGIGLVSRRRMAANA